MNSFNHGYMKSHYRGGAIRRRRSVGRLLLSAAKPVLGILCIVLLSTVYTLGYLFLTQCDYFQARDIRITGTNKLSEEEVIKQASLHPGINILSVNLSTCRKRLLAHPEIENADVTRIYPDGLRIRVTEQRPMAVIDLSKRFLMNEKGKIYREWHHADTWGLPSISGLTFSDLGDEKDPGTAPYAAVMQVLHMGSEPDAVLPNHRIKNILVDCDVGLTLITNGRPREIRLGYGDYAEKYTRLKKVTAYLNSRHHPSDFERIDLMNIDRIVVSPMEIKPDYTGKKEV